MFAFGLLTNGVNGLLAVGGNKGGSRSNEIWELKCNSDDSCEDWTLRGYFEDTRMASVFLTIPESLIPPICY